MTNRLMISVAAAALIAGTGFANAQGTGMSREAPSAAHRAAERAVAGRGSDPIERGRRASRQTPRPA